MTAKRRPAGRGRAAHDTGAQARRLRALRSRSEERGNEPVVIATLRVRLKRTPWVAGFSWDHPEVRVEFLNYSELGPGTSISDCWISGRPAGCWTPEIGRFPDVLAIESLSEMGRGGLYRVSYRDPPIVRLYRELRVPLPLPIWVQGGVCGWEVAARAPEFDRILAHARNLDPGLRVVSLRRGALRGHLPALNAKEHRLLSTAMAAGYFAVPRKLTLIELASQLRRPRSSVAEAIAAIESKLLDSAFTGIALRIDPPWGPGWLPRSRSA